MYCITFDYDCYFVDRILKFLEIPNSKKMNISVHVLQAEEKTIKTNKSL